MTELDDSQHNPSRDIIDFIVPDVQTMWAQIEGKVRVDAEPAMMPWGAYKMVILDPDSYQLRFVEEARD